MSHRCVLILFIFSIISTRVLAMDDRACSDLIRDNLYKKYEYVGVGFGVYGATSQGTKRDGFTKASSTVVGEQTTVLLDPLYWIHMSTSFAQSTSSWGACKYFSANDPRFLREIYIADHFEDIRTEFARGNGKHLEVMALYTGCEKSSYDQFNRVMRGSFDRLNTADNAHIYLADVIDAVVLGDEQLRKQCSVPQVL